MAVTLTVKQVPDALADKLRAMAQRNHRSLQGELMVLLEHAAASVEAGPRKDSLLGQWDALASGSTLGAQPWLTREEANQRPERNKR